MLNYSYAVHWGANQGQHLSTARDLMNQRAVKNLSAESQEWLERERETGKEGEREKRRQRGRRLK